MRNFLSVIAAVLFLHGVNGQESYTVNTAESVVKWHGEKVIGNSHDGILKFQEGTLRVANNEIVGGSFVVDMTTLENTDLSGGSKAKLEGHLRSADFFNVEEYGTSRLEIKSVGKDKNGLAQITADLTIKGTTKEVVFPAFMKAEGESILASAELVFDRSEFDVRYGSGSFFDNLGDKAIEDEIKVQVNLKASR
jgi:polyisoprenoid-binding protein YceI